ncbi:MAG: methyltransferase domain-containing protein [Opitutaceae bacterium]|nr:methyltransferase domain-containing protein [Opitutaceae bacterium]
MANIVDEQGHNQIFAPGPAQALRLRRRAAAIIQALPANAGPRHLLELGCGMGEMARQLAEQTDAHVTGVDISEKFIAHARAEHRRPNLDFMLADLTRQIPAAGADRYDAITGNGILHHLYHHLDTVLPALRRWLKPGGRLIFWEPNLWNPYVWLIFSFAPLRLKAKLEPDEMAFTPRYIHRRLHTAGYVNIRVTTRDFLLPNTPTGLVPPVVAASDLLDRIPLVNRLAQSLFLVAEKGPANSPDNPDRP